MLFVGSCFLRKWFEDFAVPGTCGWVRHGSFILRNRKQMSTGCLPSGCKMHLCNEKLQLQFKKLQLQFFGKLQLQFLGNSKNSGEIALWGVAVENCSCSFPKTAVAVYKTATAVCTNASVGLKSMLPFWICLWFVLGVVSIEQWIIFATWYRIASDLQKNQSAILRTWNKTNMNSALPTVLVHYTLVQYSTVNPLLIGSHKYGLAVRRS